jgi:hypothetical protein
MEHDIEPPEIRVYLNIDSFDLSDSQDLGDRLRSELDLRVESAVVAATVEPGFPLPPDVVIKMLYTLVPLADIYANVLATYIYDTLRAACSRRGRGDSEATFLVSKVDEEGRTLRKVRGRTSDPEIIKDLIRQVGEDTPANQE